MSELVQKKIAEAKKKRYSKLDLSYSDLTDIPIELTELTHLTELDLRTNNIIDISPLVKLTKLKWLALSRNQIKDVHPLGELYNLEKLILSRNQITNINPLTTLKNLTHLELGSNQIIDITPLESLKALTRLNLSRNKIQDICPLSILVDLEQLTVSRNRIQDIAYLINLKSLKQLDLSGNQISNINQLQLLNNLTWLVLSRNQIIDTTPLSELHNLTRLALSRNRIKDIYFVSKLKNLTLLDLSGNEISNISPIKTLINIIELYLSGNKISDISPLAELSKLTRIYLDFNQIIDITPLAELSNLTKIDIRYNLITDISSLSEFIKKMIPVYIDPIAIKAQIVLGHNPLEKPPVKIIDQGNEAILNYLQQLKEQGSAQLNEAKLIIVGEPYAGKSSLMKKLFDPTYQVPQEEDSTLGIQVREGWQFDHQNNDGTIFTANIWDFGGQQIQYMTHQFFLTPGAVYVLVFSNDRKEATTNFPYWFKIIHLLGEERGFYSPILVVQNNKNEEFINQFDEHFYSQRYPELQINKRTVDLRKNDDDFIALRTEIQRMLTKLPHVNDERPARWSDIRTALRDLAKSHNHINFSEYAIICTQHGIEDEASQKVLSGYLHRLGSLLHFVDDPSLQDFIILNPQWAVDAVYSVLDDTTIAHDNGYFTKAKLESIWNGKYNSIEQGKLLNLMKKKNFEICYEVDSEDDKYIAPQLLSDKRPFYEWNSIDTLRFHFQYKFMPEGIITRLIVRLNDKVAKFNDYDLVWRKGMMLESNGCRAQIIEEENRDGLKVIAIAISGNVNERKFLLRTIRDEIEKIHDKWFKNIQTEMMIPCNCQYCADPKHQDPKYFELKVLQRAQEHDKDTVECDREFFVVPVLPLLEGVFEKKELVRQETRFLEDQWQKSQKQEIHIHNHFSSTQLTEPVKVVTTNEHEPKPIWYKQWWIISIILTVLTGLIVGFWLKSWIVSIIAGLIVGYFIYTMNPKRRFLRFAMLTFSLFALSASHPLAIQFGWLDNTLNNNKWFILESGEPLNILLSFGLLVLSAWFAWLDHKQG